MKFKDLQPGRIIRRRGKGYAPLLGISSHQGAFRALNLSAWCYLYIDRTDCHLYEDLGHVLDLLPEEVRGEA